MVPDEEGIVPCSGRFIESMYGSEGSLIDGGAKFPNPCTEELLGEYTSEDDARIEKTALSGRHVWGKLPPTCRDVR